MGGYLFMRKKTYEAQKDTFSKILSKIEHPDTDYDKNLYHTKLAVCSRRTEGNLVMNCRWRIRDLR